MSIIQPNMPVSGQAEDPDERFPQWVKNQDRDYSQLNERVNLVNFEMEQVHDELGVHETRMDTIEAVKADKTEINSLASNKADKTEVNELASDKADYDYVDIEVGKKVDHTALTAGLASKVDKGGTEQITWGMLDQATKLNITGGNTPVVGANSVNTSNVVNNAITSAKRSLLGEWGMIYPTRTVDFNFTTSQTIVFPTGTRILWRNTYYSLPATVTLATLQASSDSTAIVFDTVAKTLHVYPSSQLNLVTENCILIALFANSTYQVVMNGSYRVNGQANLSGTELSFIPKLVNNTHFYVPGNNGVYFERGGSNIYFRMNSPQFVMRRGVGGMQQDYTWSKIKSELSGQTFQTSPAGVADCLVVASNNMLVYDYIVHTLRVISRDAYDSTIYMIMFTNMSGNITDGYLVKPYYIETIANHQAEIEGLKDKVDTIESGIPDYFVNGLKSVQNKTVDLQSADTITFSFMTDLHADGSMTSASSYFQEIKNHLKSLHKMKGYGSLDFLCLGGDLTSGVESTKAILKEKLSELVSGITDVNLPVFVLNGNHDDNSYYVEFDPKAANILTKQEWYNRVLRPFKSATVHDSQNSNSIYYYKDFTEKKVRVVCLDSCDYPIKVDEFGTALYHGRNYWGWGGRQLQWLSEEALRDLPGDYKVIVLTHIPIRAEFSYYGYAPRNGELLEGILKAFQDGGSYSGSTDHVDWGTSVSVNFSDQGGRKILAMIHGHNHADSINNPPDLGFPVIGVPNSYSVRRSGVESAIPGATAPTRTKGTISQDCWDVITVNVATHDIHMRRFGAGSDRNYSD